ncbi:MAG: hypothetical protein CVT62_12855 [Actinobacteria bacterium HGW-Actinobacteria-2]|nr:MAG: hypothetical protein CVT62_12855 [Actinobacteria bacterium HGW-Actinobacteria-2]
MVSTGRPAASASYRSMNSRDWLSIVHLAASSWERRRARSTNSGSSTALIMLIIAPARETAFGRARIAFTPGSTTSRSS